MAADTKLAELLDECSLQLEAGLSGVRPYRQWFYRRGCIDRRAWGVGFDPRGIVLPNGSSKGRLTIPIYDFEGCCGVACRAWKPDVEGPKYLFNAGFSKSRTLYGIERIVKRALLAKQRLPEIVVVEGFSDVWAADESGFPAVAAMGSSLSFVQGLMLGAFCDGAVTVVQENDEAGSRFVESVAAHCRRFHLRVRVADVSSVVSTPHADLCDVYEAGGVDGVNQLLDVGSHLYGEVQSDFDVPEPDLGRWEP